MSSRKELVLGRRVFLGPNVNLPCAAVGVVLDRAGLPAADRVDAAILRRWLLDRVRRQRDMALGEDIEHELSRTPLRPVELIGVLAIEMQRLFDEPVTGWRIASAGADNRIVVTVACDQPDLGLGAVEAAAAMVLAVATEQPAPPTALDRYLRAAAALARDDMMRPFLGELARRGIPAVRLNESGRFGRHVRIGHGRRQRQASGTITDRTSTIASMVTGSKHHTARMLERAGVPVPRQALVTDVEAALRAAETLGYPVAVKPDRGTAGKGVTAGVRDAAELRGAFERAARVVREVVVEGFIEGEDHRLYLIDGRLIAASQRRRAQVTGDGRSSVRALIDAVNADPRRGAVGVSVLVRLELDAAMMALLERQDLGPDDVPEDGRRVLLRSTSNIKSGGTPVDMTDLVHPDNRRMAEVAARAAAVDIAGVDFVTADISRSWLEVGGAVVEVNISPSLNFYDLLDGDRRGVARAVVGYLVPPGEDGRMPLVVVVAAEPGRADDLARAAVAVLARRCGTVCWSDGQRVLLGDDLVRATGARALDGAAIVLGHPMADAGVLALTAADVLRHGLPWPDCDVAVFDGRDADPAGRAAMAVVGRAARGGVLTLGEMIPGLPDGSLHLQSDEDLTAALERMLGAASDG